MQTALILTTHLNAFALLQEETSEDSVTFAGKRPVTKARKYVYVSNVCVREPARRRGVAAEMMGAAATVVNDWGELEKAGDGLLQTESFLNGARSFVTAK